MRLSSGYVLLQGWKIGCPEFRFLIVYDVMRDPIFGLNVEYNVFAVQIINQES